MATRWTSKHTGQKIDDTIDCVCNPNLLDNWYFGNPVDQRGGYVVPPGTTYYYSESDNVAGTTNAYYPIYYTDSNGNGTFKIGDTPYWTLKANMVRGYTGSVYGIDRWKLFSGDSGTCWMLIENDGITIGTDTKFGVYFAQIIDPSVVKAIAGKTVTLSVLAGEKSGNFSGNIIINGSWNDYWTIEANDVSTKKYTVPANATSMLIQYAEGGSGAGTCKLKAVKLELGSQQTLAHRDADGNWMLNEIPDYGEQLARCQRHQLRVGYKEDSTYSPVLATGVAISSTSIRALIPTPVTMRENPVISFFGSDTISTIHAMGNGVSLTPTAIDARVNSNGIFLNLTISGATVNETYAITLDHARGLMLDANL